jgi:hypothetical protein
MLFFNKRQEIFIKSFIAGILLTPFIGVNGFPILANFGDVTNFLTALARFGPVVVTVAVQCTRMYAGRRTSEIVTGIYLGAAVDFFVSCTLFCMQPDDR